VQRCPSCGHENSPRRVDLARVLATAGRVAEAAAVLEEAVDRYERKKNLAMLAQVRPKLDALLLELHE
jgi:hypothetical protein